jgi:hypothetical protein
MRLVCWFSNLSSFADTTKSQETLRLSHLTAYPYHSGISTESSYGFNTLSKTLASPLRRKG